MRESIKKMLRMGVPADFSPEKSNSFLAFSG